jgi:copper chaperone
MSVTTNVNISGMHCNHCIASVTEELQELAGVEGVAIDLNKDSISRAVITSRAELDTVQVQEAIAEAGYAVVPDRA